MEPVCPICQKPVAADAPNGLCPECLIKSGVETKVGNEAAPAQRAAPLSLDEMAKLFPQLEIVELLGQGGMGVVYKARQARLNRFVALKILSPERQNDPQFAERFEREARTLAWLAHPNIVTVYDFGEVQGHFYLLMEYVDGLTLRQLMQTRRLSPEEALGIVPKICEALQYAHEQGVIHRDIKPENILIDKKGQVKIADFGIAKILDQSPADMSLTGAKEIVGTPQYMAPEQIEKPQTVDRRADIYSLGVVFYEMLTGELPLGKFQPPSQKAPVDARLDEVVLRALEKEPELRYQQASQVKTAVETIAGSIVPPNIPGTPMPAGADGEPEDYELRILSCLWRGTALVFQNFLSVIGVTLLVLAITAALFLLQTFGMGKLVGMFVFAPLMGGHSLFLLKKIRGEPADLGAVFSGFRIAPMHLFLGWLIGGILTAIGFFCLVVPGIYLVVAWAFVGPLIIDKRLDFWPAMEMSRKTVTRHWWKFFIALVFFIFVKIAGIAALVAGYFFTAVLGIFSLLASHNKGDVADATGHILFIFHVTTFIFAVVYVFVFAIAHAAWMYAYTDAFCRGESPAEQPAAHPQVTVPQDYQPSRLPVILGGVAVVIALLAIASFLLLFELRKHAQAPPDSQTVEETPSANMPAATRAFTKFSGSGYTIASLDNGLTAFANRKYVWKDVPASLMGRSYTKLTGGSTASITVHGDYDTTLQIMTAPDQSGADLSGWTQTDIQFSYSDAKHTRVVVFEKKLHADEDLLIPQRNWSGVMVLMPASSPTVVAKPSSNPVSPQRAALPEPNSSAESLPNSYPREGLVALWAGERNGNDSIGANNAVLKDMTYAEGRVGRAFSLNGRTSYARIPESPSLDMENTKGMTVAAWIKPDDVHGFHPILEWHSTTTPPRGIGCQFRLARRADSEAQLVAMLVDTDGHLHVLKSAENMVVTNQWQHVAVTYDQGSGTGTLYLNGNVLAQSTWAPFAPKTKGDIWISLRPFSTPGTFTYNTHFAGLMDEIAIYNRALSAEEIQAYVTASSRTNNDSTMPDVTILSAQFGLNEHIADVTERVIQLLRSQPGGFTANAPSLGVDPKPGRGKLLTINYKYKGRALTLVVPGGEQVTYQALLNKADNASASSPINSTSDSSSSAQDALWASLDRTRYDKYRAQLNNLPPVLIVRESHYAVNSRATLGGFRMWVDNKLVLLGANFHEVVALGYGGNSPIEFPDEWHHGDLNDRFDLICTLPENGQAQLQEKIRELLKTDYDLTWHHALKDTDVLLIKIKDPQAFGSNVNNDFAQSYSTADMARDWENYFAKPVLDETGSTNRYERKLALIPAAYIPNRTRDLNVNNTFLAKYGLELVPAVRPMDWLALQMMTNNSLPATDNTPPSKTMSYTLVYEELQKTIKNPTEADIRAALDTRVVGDNGPVFRIQVDGTDDLLQIEANGKGHFHFTYCPTADADGKDCLFSKRDDISLEEALKVSLAYRNGTPDWKKLVEWRH